VSPLKACPDSGKKEGKLADRRPARFPYAMICSVCGFTIDWVADRVMQKAIEQH